MEDATSPKKNFFVYYEIDDQEVMMTVLRTEWHNGDDDGSWVLLEPV